MGDNPELSQKYQAKLNAEAMAAEMAKLITTPEPVPLAYDPTTAEAKFLAEWEASAARTYSEWLNLESKWTESSGAFFRRRCGKKDGTREKVLRNLIRAEKKLRRERTQATASK